MHSALIRASACRANEWIDYAHQHLEIALVDRAPEIMTAISQMLTHNALAPWVQKCPKRFPVSSIPIISFFFCEAIA